MTSAPERIVVVGGGLAGAKTVEALREKGFDGALTLVSDETELPYERPPLSKGYLLGDDGFDEAVVHPQDWYDEHDIDVRLGTAVMSIDRDAREIVTVDGERIGYDRLVLATGSQAKRLDVPGADAALTLRRHADSDAVQAVFGEGRHVVIVGGGWIGLEVAAAARARGSNVTVVESAELPLAGVLGPEYAQVFADLHREHGVDLRLSSGVEEIVTDDDGHVTGVRLAGGAELDADTVIFGVGASPAVELAAGAGLAIDDETGGVAVDAALRTSDPRILAVGDIAAHDHPVLGRRIRVEHWASALNQPVAAAATLLGAETPYTEPPYFFSDQYDLGMEYVGFARPGEYARVVTRGDTAGREFVGFWLDGDDHVLAAMNVNVWDVVDEIKPIIAERRVVDADKLADPQVPYGEVTAESDDEGGGE